jgi:hypothetical protein
MFVCLLQESKELKKQNLTHNAHNMENVRLLMCIMKARGLNIHQNVILTIY